MCLLQGRVRQVKPLLAVSSRLGRALAELFTLQVKLAVGTPSRQRRTQQLAAGSVPTPAADAVATTLANLLSQSLQWTPPPYCSLPKLRYFFLIILNMIK